MNYAHEKHIRLPELGVSWSRMKKVDRNFEFFSKNYYIIYIKSMLNNLKYFSYDHHN